MKHLRNLAFLTAVLIGCSPAEVGNPGATPSSPVLLSSLQARTFGTDSVTFTLQVTNTSSQPLELSYNSGQEFDFIVSRGQQEVWRWSSDRMFTQALRSETLASGETRTYAETWVPGSARGDFIVVGRLAARNHSAEQASSFRIE